VISVQVEEAANLTLELADGPVALQAFIFEKGAFPWVVNADEFLELAPRKSQQLRRVQWRGQFAEQ
jgi:hypothetical protein